MFQSGKFTENLGIVTTEHCKLLFSWVLNTIQFLHNA